MGIFFLLGIIYISCKLYKRQSYYKTLSEMKISKVNLIPGSNKSKFNKGKR
jgi:hypothetical protein